MEISYHAVRTGQASIVERDRLALFQEKLKQVNGKMNVQLNTNAGIDNAVTTRPSSSGGDSRVSDVPYTHHHNHTQAARAPRVSQPTTPPAPAPAPADAPIVHADTSPAVFTPAGPNATEPTVQVQVAGQTPPAQVAGPGDAPRESD